MRNMNSRCPLQGECKLSCKHSFSELDCEYYNANARPGFEIEDQERRRTQSFEGNFAEDETAEAAETHPDIIVCSEEAAGLPGLVYIPIELIYPHPDNPRKDVGDISELAESIKVKGVLQNLTVVPGHYLSDQEWKALYDIYRKSPSEDLRNTMNTRWENIGYTVIIGHRRLAASKVAGLTALPCSVVEMSLEDQIATMLVENMQRSDLTVYEEAKGFQMMLDLGKSVKDVSEMSGFSETTVRRRIKLAELDETKFKKAVDRGATLFDFAELDKIDDPTVKDKLLGSMGKADFKNELKYALAAQESRKRIDAYAEQVSAWATKVDRVVWTNGTHAEVNGETVELKYLRKYGKWTPNNISATEPPEEAAGKKLFYTVSENEVDVYAEITEEDRTEEAKRKAESQKKRDLEEAVANEARAISARHYQLRRDFILGFNQFKQKSAEVAEFISDTMVMYGMERRYGSEDIEQLSELLGVPLNEAGDNLDYHEFLRIKKEFPERTMLIIAFWLRDDDDEGYWQNKWDSALCAYRIVFAENEDLTETYRLLKWLGYEMSTEEEQMYKGSHKIFTYPEEQNGNM